ncbi:MAG: tRNA preQ1(34) S-adenosylmethionine ribosyltransferase-isomerase QueA [Gammaproteobacteria bacterium]|nr:tRNA preQ1(34) S-adenosylmethionine ribosyltransferase-isomerase QueA [Gammaproteobacteria bacterium]
MRADSFDYDLPPELIAQIPLDARSQSRLLVLPAPDPGDSASVSDAPLDARFIDLPRWLRAGDLLVLNDTRVVKARLRGHKETGGQAELLLERVLDEHRVLAQVKASKSPRPGTRLRVGDKWLRVIERSRDLFVLELPAQTTAGALMQSHGRIPLPPYIERAAGRIDEERYQTVFAREEGAVAAPTAGLHLDREMLAALPRAGIEIGYLTLHVGAGTFQPLRSENLDEHVMHAERIRIDARLCEQVERTRARGGRVVAVGTTCVRALESASSNGRLMPFDGETSLFIQPGYRFACVDAMITNFHLPRSTLLILVCAFCGTRRMLDAYRHAVAQRYRFFSYGDATLLFRHEVVDA